MPDRTIPHHIVTTEVRQRKTVITLDVVEIHEILQDWALRKVYADPAGTLDRIEVELNVTPTTDENYVIDATCTVTETLPTPADSAPPNIEETVRLNPPGAPGLSQRQITDTLMMGKSLPGTNADLRAMDNDLSPVVIQAKSRTLKEPTSFETLNTTATSSRENIEAIERMKKEQPALLKAMDVNSRYTEIKTGIPRDLWMEDLMKRVNKIHAVSARLGHNIVLSRDEVDTLLEYINVGAPALDRTKDA